MITIDKDNIKHIRHYAGCIPEKHFAKFLSSLLDEVDEINMMSNKKKLCITWENEHTEYSPERTDPCPDYYGFFYIMMNGTNHVIGDAMTIEQLDESLSLLYDFVEAQNIEKDE